MRVASLLFVFSYLLLQPLTAQSPERGTWERIAPTGTVTAMVATPDAAWWAMQGYLSRIDLISGKVTTDIRIPGMLEHFGIHQLWVSPEGELHAIGGGNKLAILRGGDWEVHDVLGGLLIDLERTLLYRTLDGTYLLQGPAGPLLRWRTDGGFSGADDLNQLIGWSNWPHTVYDEFHDRIWVAKDHVLRYVSDEERHTVEVPGPQEDIQELKTDADGSLWVRMARRLLRYRNGQWATFSYPATFPVEQTRFVISSRDEVFLLTKSRQLMVSFGADGTDWRDLSDDLTGLYEGDPVTVDYAGVFWSVQPAALTVSGWCPEKTSRFSLPMLLPDWILGTKYFTTDADKRVWISTDKSAYCFADRAWHPLEAVYPGLPPGSPSLLFTPRGVPLARLEAETEAGYYAYHPARGWVRFIDTLFTDTYLPRLEINNAGHLQWLRTAPSSYVIYDRGELVTIRASDLSPGNFGFEHLYVHSDGTQLFAVRRGVFKRFGQTLDFVPFDDEYIHDGLVAGSVNFSPSGTLWLTNQSDIYTWRDEKMTPLPPLLTPEGLPVEKHCRRIFPLSDTNVWVQLFAGALYHFDGPQWTQFFPEDFSWTSLPYAIRMVCDDRGRSWIQARNDLWVYTPPKSTPLSRNDRSTTLSIAPNPARQTAWIGWDNESEGSVTLRLYTMNGRLIRTLMEGRQAAGNQSYVLHRDGLATGVYLLVLENSSGRATGKLLIR